MTEVSVQKVDAKSVKGSPEWGNALRKRARELSRQLDTGYMELGQILWEVYDTPAGGNPVNGPIFKTWGYTTFGEWAEGELNIHRRKAERLRGIWYKLEVELKDLDRATKKRLIGLGWSKVRELIPVLSAGNANEWADLGEKLNYPNLCAAIQTYKRKVDESHALSTPTEAAASSTEEEEQPLPKVDATIDPDDFQLKDKHFYALKRSEAEVVEEALDRAAQISHKENHSRNLAMICTDFLATNDFRKKSDPENIARYFARLENSTGYKMIIIDPETNRVVYGLPTLERLAKGGDV